MCVYIPGMCDCACICACPPPRGGVGRAVTWQEDEQQQALSQRRRAVTWPYLCRAILLGKGMSLARTLPCFMRSVLPPRGRGGPCMPWRRTGFLSRAGHSGPWLRVRWRWAGCFVSGRVGASRRVARAKSPSPFRNDPTVLSVAKSSDLSLTPPPRGRGLLV